MPNSLDQALSKPSSETLMFHSLVPLRRNFDGHPLAGLFGVRRLEVVLLQEDWKKVPSWRCLSSH